MGEEQKYLNPITFEAKMFAESLNNLSENYDALDVHLINSLENVMTSIEALIDKNANKPIVETNKTKLLQCDDFRYINRIYHCTRCKQDLGKSMAKVALHLASECGAPAKATTQQAASNTKKVDDVKKVKIDRQEERMKRRKKKDEKWLKGVKLTKKTVAFLTMSQRALNQFLGDFVQVGEKLKCIPEYKLIENDLMELLKPLVPQQSIKVYNFGSRISGVGTRESDLDIFIDIGETFKIFENVASKETLQKLYKLRDGLQIHKKTWKGLVVIDKARVPILRIIHSKTGIECDINVSNGLGYINSQLLEFIFTLQPMALLMCIYMKKWLLRTNLKGDFCTYSINLLVIFYLQHLKFLPPLSKLFENVDLDTALMVGPWLGSYVPLTLSELGLQLADPNKFWQYINGFFDFYSEFDYKTYVICPYTGEPVKKEDLNSVMPSRYTTFVESEKDLEIDVNRAMVVQDPIQLDNNVTKRLSVFGLKVFTEFLLLSLEHMCNDSS